MGTFRLDEGYSEDPPSHDENGRNISAATAAAFQEWVMAQNEDARSDIAYEVLRTLRTSKIAAVVERLTPLLHMDPLEKLPPEITSEIFSYLDASTLLVASLASKTWRSRILDSRLWQHLYTGQGWGIDVDELKSFENGHVNLVRQQFKKARPQFRGFDAASGQPNPKKRATADWLDSKGRKVSTEVSQWREQHGIIEADTDSANDGVDQVMYDAPSGIGSPQRPNKRHSQESGDEMDIYTPTGTTMGEVNAMKPFLDRHLSIKPQLIQDNPQGEERINWSFLYKQRQRLEENWTKGNFTNFQLPHPDHAYEAHTECVYTIQFHGKWLVSGSRDKTLRVWDLETRRLRGKTLTGHLQSVLCLQFDPTEDEDVIISGSSDCSVIVWCFSTGQKLKEIPQAHEESVLNLRFDKRFLVTCSKDKKIKVWNRREITAKDPEYPAYNHTKAASATLPSYIVDTAAMDISLLEARMANGTIKKIQPYTLLMTLYGHSAAVNAIQINGDMIVSASGDRQIKVWNVKDGSSVRTVPGHNKGIACVQFDSKRIVSGSSDNTVRIYDAATGAEVAVLLGHSNLVRTVQAGFGDMPGSEHDDMIKQQAAEKQYLAGVASGAIVENRDYHRRIVSGQAGSSRLARGSKLPPGGGGSKWGRIVSGSYDETIIIWRKNPNGDWVTGQTLRQEAAVRRANGAEPAQVAPPPAPAATPANPPAPAPQSAPQQPASNNVGSSTGPAGVANPSVASASQLMQQAMGVTISSTISNVLGMGRNLGGVPSAWNVPPRSSSGQANAHANTNSTMTPGMSQAMHQIAQHTQNVVQHAMQQAVNNHAQQSQLQPQPTQAQNQTQTYHQQATGQQNHGGNPEIPESANNGQHPLSRVFKLQFDARRIVCCSQDSRIIGWDFANGDKEIEEASRFFLGP